MQIKNIASRATAIVAACALGVGLAGFATGAHAIDIPSPPGWQLQWGDNFNGAAGSLPSAANWRIDTGHAYPNGPVNWGTSEIENYTSDPSNLHLDGKGH